MGWLAGITAAIGSSSAVNGLVDISVKAALVFLGALALTRVLRRASASTRHQVWTVALVSVVALPALTAALPAWQVPVLPPAAVSATSSPVPSAAEQASATAPASAVGSPDPVTAAVSRDQRDQPQLRSGSGGVPPGDQGGGDSAAFGPGAFGHGDVAAILLAFWILGVVFLLSRLMFSAVAAWRIVRQASPVRDAVILRQARAVRDQLGIRGEVNLVQTDRISMPMAWGVLRSTVLLPAESAAWTHARRRVVLLHEMAHLKRRDCQTLLLARIVTALHWFNPLAWTATRRLQAERERACDDLVLSVGTRRSEYAQHLLEIARAMRAPGSPGWATVAMARPSELEGRLLAILDPRRNRRRATRAATVVGLVAMSLLVLPLAALQPRATAQEVKQVEMVAQQGEGQAGRQIARQVQLQLQTQLEIQARVTVELPIELEIAAALGELNIGTEISTSLAAGLPSLGQDRQAVNPRVMQAFFTALSDEEPEIRAEAAYALGRMESADATPVLTEVLEGDAVASVREQAAWALGMIEDDTAVLALSAALADEDAAVREQAAWALGMIESDAGVEALARVLQTDESGGVREQAAWALGMIESADGVAALSGALTDAGEDVREEAAWALGMIESPAAVEALSALLRNDPSADVREQAAWALGMIEDEAALDVLLDAMTDEDIDVRKQALWAVGQISG